MPDRREPSAGYGWPGTCSQPRRSWLWERIQIGVERRKLLSPETLVVPYPGLDLLQPLRLQPIVPLTPRTSLGDQPGIKQDAQMLRDSRPGRSKMRRQTPDRLIPGHQQIQQLAAHRMRDRAEDITPGIPL